MKTALLAVTLLVLPGAFRRGAAAEPAVSFESSEKRCPETDQKALLEVTERWKEGYNTGNTNQIASLYASDAYYLTQHFPEGILRGRDQIKAYFQRGADAGFRVDKIAVEWMDCSGDLAYTVGRYESTNAGEKAYGVNLVVLRKASGKWLIVAHESAVPEARPEPNSRGRQTSEPRTTKGPN